MTEPPVTTPPETLRFLEPRSSCQPCIESLDELDWVAASTFRIGPWALGVRSSSTEIDAALRDILAAHVIARKAPANFSVLMADESGSDPQTRAFNFLYRASDSVVRTRAPGRLIRTLVQYLSDFAEPAPPTLRLDATALISGGKAVIVPPEVRDEMTNIETRLNVAGIQVVDGPLVHLDGETGLLVVPEPSIAVDTDALADFERRHPPARREEPAPAAGRYPIAAWSFVTDANRVGPLGAAQGVAAAAQLVVNADQFGAQPTLDVLAGALTRSTVAGLWWIEPAELVGQLRELVRG